MKRLALLTILILCSCSYLEVTDESVKLNVKGMNRAIEFCSVNDGVRSLMQDYNLSWRGRPTTLKNKFRVICNNGALLWFSIDKD